MLVRYGGEKKESTSRIEREREKKEKMEGKKGGLCLLVDDGYRHRRDKAGFPTQR